jgi:arylsulfatase A-like enzyme
MSGIIRKLIIYGILILLISCREGKDKESLPNIIVILADDLGWSQLGCYGGPYQTPNIDGLAAGGMRFTNAYASAAVCSPTRAALMTGKYPARLHLTDFIKGSLCPDSLLKQPVWQKYLPLKEITMGEVFKEYGYRTAIFGKWHLSIEKNPPESAPFNPDKQGFDEFMVTYKPVKGLTDPEHDPHNVDSITNRAIKFLEENHDRPFLMIVSHNSIHDPVMEGPGRTEAYMASFPYPKVRVVPELGAMVNRLDDGTGRLFAKMKELDLEENTIVLFCSDNGGKETYASQFPFRKGKGWLYEGGIRVPMIARWPGRIEAGSQNTAVTYTIDILPTLLELAGFSRTGQPIDGISIAGELLGNGHMEERTQYWHYPHYHLGSGMKPASAIRKGKFKLIEWHEEFLKGESAWELYDLETDPGEKHDLSANQPELLRELRMQLHQWRGEVNAQMPEINDE